MELADRIRQLIERKNVTPYQVSKETGVAESTFSKILDGTTKKINNNTCVKLSNYFNVSKSWLLSGEGEMLKKDIIEDPVESYKNPTLAEMAAALKDLAESNKMMAKSNMMMAESNRIIADANKILSETNKDLAKKISSLKEDIVEAVAVKCAAAEK